MNVTFRIISNYAKTQPILNGVICRDTVRQIYPFSCKFTGYEAIIILDGSRIIVPGIYFLECDKLAIPKGSPILIPVTSILAHQNEARPYLEAEIILENDDTLPPIAPVVISVPPLAVNPTLPVNPTTTNNLYPAHIKQLIIADSIRRNETCVITGEAFTQENACITTCGHVFTRSGLTRWLSVSSKQSCPVCRQECHLA